MDNTLENKAKFFALYYGQRVYRHNAWNTCRESIEVSHSTVNGVFGYLELTSILSITDEDAIEVAKILRYKEDDYFVKNFGFKAFEYLKDEIKEAKHGFLGHVVNESSRVLAAADYLRSQGYYLGDGTEIDYGWVKLKESEVGNA